VKFLVTGGLGFIGSYVVKYLVDQGHQITVVDNFWRGRLENLTGFENKVDIQKLDILDFEQLRNVVEGCEGIFHHAALTSVPESFTQKEKYHKVNVDGTENIFKLGKEYGIKVIYASSSSVYGNQTSIPIKENSKKNPLNPYGMTKLEDEILAEKYSNLGVEIIGLRYFNVYGIGQTIDYAGVITKFNDAIQVDKPPTIFGDGSQIRDFVSVEDVAKANLMAMQSKTKNAFVNIGTGIAISINELATMMIELSGKPLKPIHDDPRKGDVQESQADVNLAKTLIGWKFETNLKDGLKNFFFS